jgi:tetratricopeptide (TPR) repeat protein
MFRTAGREAAVSLWQNDTHLGSTVSPMKTSWARNALLAVIAVACLLLILQTVLKWHTVQGRVYHLINRPETAIAKFEEALAVDPRNAYAHFYLGEIYLEQEQFAKAASHLHNVTTLVKDHHKAYFLMGIAYARQQLYGPAIRAMTIATQLKKGEFAYHFNLGLAYKEARRYGEAVAAFEDALRNKDDDDLRFNLGFALHQLGRLDEAQSHLEKAVQANPQHRYAHAELARVYIKQGRRDQAISAFQSDLRIAPDRFFSHYDLGRLYRQSGQLHLAREILEKAATIDPEYPYTYAELSQVYAGLGLTEQAESAKAAFTARQGSESSGR